VYFKNSELREKSLIFNNIIGEVVIFMMHFLLYRPHFCSQQVKLLQKVRNVFSSFQAKLAKLYTGLLGYNSEIGGQTGPTRGQTRGWQVGLLKDMVSLIEMREQKIPKEEGKNILGEVKIMLKITATNSELCEVCILTEHIASWQCRIYYFCQML
jgi:hypothetical protein